MDALLAQVGDLAKTTDADGRMALAEGLRSLQYTLEGPHEAMQRVMYSSIVLTMARIGCDLKLFTHLAESEVPLTADELAKKTGAELLLLSRILRYLASQGMVRETDLDTYGANSMTKTLAEPGWQSGVYNFHDLVRPMLPFMPEHLKQNGYKSPTDFAAAAFQLAWHTDLPAFAWLPQHPYYMNNFNAFMSQQRIGSATWLSRYPYAEKAQGLGSEQVLFVDIGGGIGHQAVALRDALPDHPNRIVVQDLPHAQARAIQRGGVEWQAQDFWKAQVIQGARMYYLRNILHDYPDAKVLQILANVKAAMGRDSVVLIDDIVVPDRGAHWQATQIDIVMMGMLASLERTETQWRKLLADAGLRIVNIYPYILGSKDSVIECVPV